MLIYTPPSVDFKKVMEGLMQLSPMTSLTMRGGSVHSNCIWWTRYWDAVTDLQVLRLQSVRNTAVEKEFPILLQCSRLTELEIRECVWPPVTSLQTTACVIVQLLWHHEFIPDPTDPLHATLEVAAH